MSSHETLGLLLVRDGVITRPQLYDALRLQRQNNRLLGTCLLELGYLSPVALLECLSRQLAIPALPPGTLDRAAPEAVSRVPAELAIRLRILPFSWDGQMLGVAVADGRVLNHLHEVAYQIQAAVGAYVALEIEIDAMLGRFYRRSDETAALAVEPVPLVGRPRPARVEPLAEVPTRDFGVALGLEPVGPTEPVPLGAPKVPSPPLSRQPPPPAPPQKSPATAAINLMRMPFYDAIEQIYVATCPAEVGTQAGRALLNYFARVVVTSVESTGFDLLGYAGLAPPPLHLSTTQLPRCTAALERRAIAYGSAGTDLRAEELVQAFGCGGAATSLIATLGDGQAPRLLLYADNGARAELYEDLHDVELLCKEAETALGILRGP